MDGVFFFFWWSIIDGVVICYLLDWITKWEICPLFILRKQLCALFYSYLEIFMRQIEYWISMSLISELIYVIAGSKSTDMVTQMWITTEYGQLDAAILKQTFVPKRVKTGFPANLYSKYLLWTFTVYIYFLLTEKNWKGVMTCL